MYELKDLNKFIGKWITKGLIPPTDGQTEILIRGVDIYEWLPGGYCLLHQADVTIGEERNQTYEIIGLDKSHEFFTMQHFDSQGNSGFMKATYIDGIWTFQGEELRFNGSFSKDESVLSGVWEILHNRSSWSKFMEITLVRQPE